MNLWLRRTGLGALLATLGAALIAARLYAPLAIEVALERAGTALAGAKVELDSASVSLWPLGVSLHQLAVANAEQPMRNLVQFERAQARVALPPLILGQVVVEQLSVGGLQFNGVRQTSGALPTASSPSGSEASDATREPASPDADTGPLRRHVLPEIETVLARESLQTVEHGQRIREEIERRRQAVEQAFSALPSRETLQQYRTELDQILKRERASVEDLQNRRHELTQWRAKLKADRKALRQARDEVRAAIDTLQQQWEEWRQLPEADYRRLVQRYTLDPQGAGAFAALLFGSEAEQWLQSLLQGYRRIEPFLAFEPGRSDSDSITTTTTTTATTAGDSDTPPGRYIHFPTATPWPGLWIQNLTAEGKTALGAFELNLRDISDQPTLISRATTATIDSPRWGALEALQFKAHWHGHRQPSYTELELEIGQLPLGHRPLGNSGLALAKAQLAVRAEARIDTEQLTGSAQLHFTETQFDITQRATSMTQTLLEALRPLQQFELALTLTGDLATPELSLKSNLDQQLKRASEQALKARLAQWQTQLKARLAQKLAAESQPLSDSLKQWQAADSDLDTTQETLQSLLAAKLEPAQEQKKKALRNKLEEKLKSKAEGALDKLFK